MDKSGGNLKLATIILGLKDQMKGVTDKMQNDATKLRTRQMAGDWRYW